MDEQEILDTINLKWKLSNVKFPSCACCKKISRECWSKFGDLSGKPIYVYKDDFGGYFMSVKPHEILYDPIICQDWEPDN